jgi:basic membrane protein A and related proteins
MNRQFSFIEFRLSIILVAALLASITTAGQVLAEGPLKVGFVYIGSISDLGWTQTHDQGRKYLEKTMNGRAQRVQTTIAENVPETAQVERVVEKMIAQGNKLIFCTSYGYLEPVLRVAARHPDVIFMQCQRHSSAKNVGTYFASQQDPMYVAGFIAGKMTKKNKLGYVAGHPVPPVLACVNAFALGAQKANAKARVQVVWNNSWSDPPNEAEATKGLVESGADVIASQLNTSSTVVQTAEKEHVYSVGMETDLSHMAPKGWLVAQTWNWGPLYVKIAGSVLDHKWNADNARYSMKDGYVGISALGSVVPEGLRKEAKVIEQNIESGKIAVFQGPIKDNSGATRVAIGAKASAKELEEMNWLVAGVDGSVTNKVK